MKQTSIQERVQQEISGLSQKKRKELTDKERVRLLQLKLYHKAKQEKEYNRKSQRRSRLYGQQAYHKLVKEYGLITPYRSSGLRPVKALR